MTAPEQESAPPTVIGIYRYWRKIRWPDGRVETVNKQTARRLGAIEKEEVNVNDPKAREGARLLADAMRASGARTTEDLIQQMRNAGSSGDLREWIARHEASAGVTGGEQEGS